MHTENNVVSLHSPRDCWWCWMFATTDPHDAEPHATTDPHDRKEN